MKHIFILGFLSCALCLSSQTLGLYPIDFKFESNKFSRYSEPKRFFLLSATSVNSTESLLTNLQGSQKVNFIARIKTQKDVGQSRKWFRSLGWDNAIGVNVFNLKPNGIPVDSFDITSLLFPETGNFGFIFTPILHYFLKQNDNTIHRLSAEISFSFRQNRVNDVIQKDSLGVNTVWGPGVVNFTSINYNFMPLRYNFVYQPSEDSKIDFNVGVYANWFNLPDEDASNFNRFYPEKKPLFKDLKNSSIFSLGLKLSCGINGFLVFADLRQNTGPSTLEFSNPLKGFVYNVGIAQNISIFKL